MNNRQRTQTITLKQKVVLGRGVAVTDRPDYLFQRWPLNLGLSLGFSFCDEIPGPKANREEKDLFHLTASLQSIIWRWQRCSRQETRGRNWCTGHRGTLLTSLSTMVCSVYFPIASRTTNPGEVSPTSELGPPVSINQSNVPLAHMAIWRCIFQLRFLFLNDSKFVNLNWHKTS